LKPDPRSAGVAALLTGLVALGPLSTDLYLPSLPSLTGVFHTDVARVQLTLSVFLLGFAVSQLIYGPLSDRFGRVPMLIGGLTIYLLASLACVFSISIEALIIARFFQALGGCCGPVLGRAIVRDVYGGEQAARVLAYISSATALAPALGPVLGGYLHLWFGWKSSFYTLATIGALLLGLVLFALRETNAHRNPHATDPGHLLKNYYAVLTHKSFLGYALCVAFAYSGIFAFISGSSFVLIDVLHVKPEHFGLCFATAVAGYMTGTVSVARLTLRLGIDRMIAAGSLLAAIAGSVMALFAWAGVVTLTAVLVPTFFCFISAGILMPNAMAGAIHPFPKMAGAASALMGFTQMSFAASVGYLVGHLHNGTPLPMALAMAGVGWSAFACYCLLVHRAGVTSMAKTYRG
jgi:MFS transporter, DHA1 family, multidrug resistance protein